MATNEEQDRGNGWKQQFAPLFLGVFLATSAGVATTWLESYIERRSESGRERVAEAALLAAFRAEIETNIIGLHTVFSNYESADTAGLPLQLKQVSISTIVFKENASKVSEISDLGFVSELVAFYTALDWINSWPGSDSPQDASPQVALTHASQVANLLHGALYLQARLASRMEALGGPLSKPSLNEQQQHRLRRIETFRQKAGARPPQDSLDFHGETRKLQLP